PEASSAPANLAAQQIVSEQLLTGSGEALTLTKVPFRSLTTNDTQRGLSFATLNSPLRRPADHQSGNITFAKRSLFVVRSAIRVSAAGILLVAPAFGQDNYEIQVYGADTVEAHHTMVELHSNFTFQGSKESVDGVLPTEHAWHETIEITHGFNSWFET